MEIFHNKEFYYGYFINYTILRRNWFQEIFSLY